MAEINYNNLYNQLKPMEKRYYDQQFSKNYVPGQENIKLSSQPAYEQMKAAYEAEQQIPESSIFDSIFGSASAAEMPQVPNLTYRNITPTFDLATGITNTTAASPFINTADILNQYNIPGLRNQDLVNQIIEQNMQKNVGNFINAPQDYYPSDLGFINAPQDYYPGGITKLAPLQNLGIDTSYGVANEPDVEQVESLVSDEPKGIAKLFEFISNFTPFGLVRRGLESLRGLNNRIQGSDFGQATSLMDYLDMRKYGGAQGRRDAAARNMAQAKGITKSLASRPSSTSGGYQQGPGGSGKQSTGASQAQQQAGPGFSGSGSAAEMGSF